jgi:hypothetical protein
VRRAWGGLGVREVVLYGPLVDTKKRKHTHTHTHTHLFFVLFLVMVGAVVDGCGISQPPGCYADHLFG